MKSFRFSGQTGRDSRDFQPYEIKPVETLRWSSANAWDGMVQGWRRTSPTALRYGIYLGLILGAMTGVRVLFFISSALGSWSYVVRTTGVVWTLSAGILAMLIIRSGRWRSGLRHRLTSVVAGTVINGLMAGAAAGLGTGLITWLMGNLLLKILIQGPAAWTMSWLVSGLSIGISVGLAMGLMGGLRGNTRAVEPLQGMRPTGWPGLILEGYHGLQVGMKMAVMVSLVVGLLAGIGMLVGVGTLAVVDGIRRVLTIVVLLSLLTLLVVIFYFLVLTLVGAMTVGVGVIAPLGALFGALSRGLTGPDIVRRTTPNQGIRQSAVNMGLFALMGGSRSG